MKKVFNEEQKKKKITIKKKKKCTRNVRARRYVRTIAGGHRDGRARASGVLSAFEGCERASRARHRPRRESSRPHLYARRVWRALDALRSQTAAANRPCRRCYLRDDTRRPLLRGVRAHVLTLEFRASRIFKAKAENFFPVSLLPRQRRALSVYAFYEWEL